MSSSVVDLWSGKETKENEDVLQTNDEHKPHVEAELIKIDATTIAPAESKQHDFHTDSITEGQAESNGEDRDMGQDDSQEETNVLRSDEKDEIGTGSEMRAESIASTFQLDPDDEYKSSPADVVDDAVNSQPSSEEAVPATGLDDIHAAQCLLNASASSDVEDILAAVNNSPADQESDSISNKSAKKHYNHNVTIAVANEDEHQADPLRSEVVEESDEEVLIAKRILFEEKSRDRNNGETTNTRVEGNDKGIVVASKRVYEETRDEIEGKLVANGSVQSAKDRLKQKEMALKEVLGDFLPNNSASFDSILGKESYEQSKTSPAQESIPEKVNVIDEASVIESSSPRHDAHGEEICRVLSALETSQEGNMHDNSQLEEKNKQTLEQPPVSQESIEQPQVSQMSIEQPTIISGIDTPSKMGVQNQYVDMNAPIVMVPSQHLLIQQPFQQQIPMYANPNTVMSSQNLAQQSQPSRRKMKLRLLEKIERVVHSVEGKKSIFSLLKRPKSRSIDSSDEFLLSDKDKELVIDGSPQVEKIAEERGEITVSWYDGTSAVELQDHVRKSVENKLRLGRKRLLLNLRVIDESVDPPEEIVLSPYIPDGSKFLLTFRIKDLTKKWDKHMQHNRAPPSPSAAPSPPGEIEQELRKQISDVLTSEQKHRRISTDPSALQLPDIRASTPDRLVNRLMMEQKKMSKSGEAGVGEISQNDVLAQRLEKLNDTLLLLHDEGTWAKEDENYVKTEKKQVIFVLANYFVLFLSLIAISAEIHERAPGWIEWMNENVTIVQNCSAGKDELFQCVTEGNIQGLIASVILWASKSVATKRLFLFGFDSPQKLWTVVYEAGVSAICWGTSYLAIRRGLNPDTRPNCLRKYWKDAVYGSLAGFNAAFMKAVLKNLLPQADEILDVMEHKQIRLFKFLGDAFRSQAEL